jgi:hypothetical protein
MVVNIPVPPIPTPWIERTLVAPRMIPSSPRWQWRPPAISTGRLFLCSGVNFVSPGAGSLPAPLSSLCEAFRNATNVEVWRLMPWRDMGLVPVEYADHFTYRDCLITGLMRERENSCLIKTFSMIAQALEHETSAWDIGEVSYREERLPLNEAIRTLNFRPDLVVTFLGPNLMRLEVELSSGCVLLRIPSKSGFIVLDRNATATLREFADTVRLPENPAIVPSDAFAGVAE